MANIHPHVGPSDPMERAPKFRRFRFIGNAVSFPSRWAAVRRTCLTSQISHQIRSLPHMWCVNVYLWHRQLFLMHVLRSGKND